VLKIFLVLQYIHKTEIYQNIFIKMGVAVLGCLCMSKSFLANR